MIFWMTSNKLQHRFNGLKNGAESVNLITRRTLGTPSDNPLRVRFPNSSSVFLRLGYRFDKTRQMDESHRSPYTQVWLRACHSRALIRFLNSASFSLHRGNRNDKTYRIHESQRFAQGVTTLASRYNLSVNYEKKKIAKKKNCRGGAQLLPFLKRLSITEKGEIWYEKNMFITFCDFSNYHAVRL